jgi:hypothetical protein
LSVVVGKVGCGHEAQVVGAARIGGAGLMSVGDGLPPDDNWLDASPQETPIKHTHEANKAAGRHHDGTIEP